MNYAKWLALFSVLTVGCSHLADNYTAGSNFDLSDGHANLRGSSEVSWLPGTWNGDQTQAAYASDVLVLNSDGSLSQTEFRQVGSAGDTGTPFPTTCLYQQTASSYVVYSVNGSGFPYQLRYSATDIALLPDVRNSPGCATFIQRAQALVKVGTYVSGVLVTQFSGGVFTDDHGENFTKQ